MPVKWYHMRRVRTLCFHCYAAYLPFPSELDMGLVEEPIPNHHKYYACTDDRMVGVYRDWLVSSLQSTSTFTMEIPDWSALIARFHEIQKQNTPNLQDADLLRKLYDELNELLVGMVCYEPNEALTPHW